MSSVHGNGVRYWALEGVVATDAVTVFNGKDGQAGAEVNWANGSYNNFALNSDSVTVFNGYYGNGSSGNADALGGADLNRML